MSFVHIYLYFLLQDLVIFGVLFPFTEAFEYFLQPIQQVLGIATALYSGCTGLYRGCVVSEKVALGAKCPVVSFFSTAFFV
jgi:hypothetical protein